MSKKSILIILALIILVGAGIYLWQREAKNSQFSVPVTEKENHLIYSNPDYGYTLEIPKDWLDKFEIKEDENQTLFLYSAYPEKKEPIFQIIVFSKERWDMIQSEPGYYGTEIASTNDLVFIYTIPLENPYALDPYVLDREKADEFQKMVGDVQSVVKTFKLE